jgi:beta-glucosidase-like glycosyl hydrolase
MPFQKLFEAHPQAGVMTAHVAFPDIDPTGQVATYSSLFLNDLLRTRWAFSGLIITDDLEMAGASSPGSIGERAVRAVEAGSDLVMVAWKESNQRQAHRALVSAIRSGRLSRSRVDMSLRRILEKRRTLAFEKPSIAPGFNAIIARSFNDMRGLTQELTRKRFAAEIQNRGSRAQISTGERVVVITGHRSFYNTFRSKWTTARLFPLSRSSIGNVVTAYAKWPGETFVYYVSGVQTARPLASLSAEDRARTMVVNATYPALIENPQEFKAVIHLATRNSQAGVWLAEALTSPALRAPTADKKEATAEP